VYWSSEGGGKAIDFWAIGHMEMIAVCVYIVGGFLVGVSLDQCWTISKPWFGSKEKAFTESSYSEGRLRDN
jgi:hypothetical protein